MNPITHLLVGWCTAETAPQLDHRSRVLVTLAGIAPDADGFGALPEMLTRNTSYPLFWWTDYHHLLAHNALFCAGVAILTAAVARTNRFLSAILALVAIHLHLLGDIVGARGPDGFQWPIPYFWPFSREPELVWSGQWALNAWPNVAITVACLAATFVLAWKRGYSPIGIVSSRADAGFVGAIRARFPR
jgi:inner membrane protein